MAENIRVTLTLDDRSYVANLKAAESATKSFAKTAETDANNATTAFGKLSAMSQTVAARFNGIKTAIVGLAFGAVGRSALAMADELQDLSNASGIAVGRLLELKSALTVAGGQADQMPTAINNFLRSIDEAAQGSVAAQNKFIELGVSLEDLRTKGEQDLFIQTLKGIVALPSASERAAAMMDKFGKSFKTVDPAELLARLEATKGTADRYADSIKRAADLNDQLATAQGVLKLALLETFSPVIKKIVDFNDAINEGSKKIDTLVTIMKTLAVIVSAVFAFTAVGAAVRIIGGLGRAVGSLTGLFSEVGVTITKVFQAGGPAMTVLRYAGGLIAAAAAGLMTIVGLKPEEKTAGAGRGGQGGPTAEELAAYEKQKSKEKSDAEQARAIDQTNRRNAINGIREVNKEFAKQQTLRLASLDLETSLVGKTEEEKQTATAQRQLALDYMNTQEQLIKRRDSLSKDEAYLAGEINATLKRNADEYTRQSQELGKSLVANQTAQLLERDRLNTLERITKAYEEQQKRAQALATAQLAITGKMQDVKFEGAQMNRSPLQRQIAAIQEESRKAALEAGRAYAAAFEDTGDGMTPERAQELADGLEKIAQGYKDIADAQLANLEQSRSWNQGWKDAFNEYVDNANNAAQQAKTYFDTFAKGFEDAIVSLVTNGKWSFKDFANSIIADFARIQARKMLTGLMGGEGGGGIMSSLFSWGKSLLGFANGGGVMSNNPIIVGERGPELFVPKSAGYIVPNNQLGGSREKPQPVTVNYNINAVDAASFRSLVARDPGFIYAVTEQGRRSQPTRRVA